MISTAKNLPSSFEPSRGENIKWGTPLGSHGYSTPIIYGDKILIGANNFVPRDEKHQGDRGVLLCLNKEDASLYWQLVVPRIEGDRHNDWPLISIASVATVEEDRVYILTSRSEILCLDMKGHYNGNDGVFQGEKWYMSPTGEFSYEVTTNDADIIWMYDLRMDLGMCPHDTPHASILLDGNYLYINTCNGVNYKHKDTACPDAPSLIALDKRTGELIAQDKEHFGPRIFHSSWASPSMGVVNGRKLLFFAGPDGIIYAFDALPEELGTGMHYFNKVWQFDGDPAAPKEDIHSYLKNREVSPSGCLGMPVFYKNRIYVTVGGDIWWGKREVWLKCIDASGEGDITDTGLVWSQELERHSSATPAISNGRVYITDCGKNLHCLDAETGDFIWSHQLRRESWSSPLVADNKVFVGSLGRDFWILEEGREKNVLDSAMFSRPIHSTAAAADGVLYISTMDSLFAVE